MATCPTAQGQIQSVAKGPEPPTPYPMHPMKPFQYFSAMNEEDKDKNEEEEKKRRGGRKKGEISPLSSTLGSTIVMVRHFSS